jgi:catechol 2,3-dioxygenase-like lactoylglutathione lyase family enzyme
VLKKDWELNHVCLVVRSDYRALGYYQSTEMGISVGPQVMGMDYKSGGPVKFNRDNTLPRVNGGSGPGKPLEIEPKPAEKNKINTYKYMDKDVQVGDLLLELGQNMEIPLEGITHICFNVPDIKGETNKLLEKGCKEMLSFIQGDVMLENHIDNRKYGYVNLSFRPSMRSFAKRWTDYNQSHPMLKNWKFHGLGIGVRDLDKLVEYYEMLDITEFQPETELDSRSFASINLPGETTDSKIKARVRVGYVGPVAFEFFQPLEDSTLYQESLDSRGEGVADLAFTVANLEEETAALKKRGVNVFLSGKPETGPAFAYFDTREHSGNIMIRLIQRE